VPKHSEGLKPPVDGAVAVCTADSGWEASNPDQVSSPGGDARHTAQARNTVVNLATGEAVRRRVMGAIDPGRVVQVARRVATGKTAGMTDEHVVRWLAENQARQSTIAGHVHERLDEDAVKALRAVRKALGLRPGPLLKLYDAQNRPSLDGFYQQPLPGGVRYAQHKLSSNPTTLAQASKKIPAHIVRRQTELVVPRGTRAVAEPTATAMHSVRETGHSLSQVRGMLQRAADPARAAEVGARAAKKLTLRGAAGAAAVGGGLTAITSAVAVARRQKTMAEASTDVAWSAGEAALSATATAAATVAVTPAVAASGSALAASSVVGTTALAAGVAVAAPVAVSLAVAAGVGYGVRRLRDVRAMDTPGKLGGEPSGEAPALHLWFASDFVTQIG